MTIDLQSHIGRLSAERERLEALLGRHPAWSAWRGALARGLTGKTLQAHRDNVEQVLARDPVFAAWQALTAAIAVLDEVQAELPQAEPAESASTPAPEAPEDADRSPAANRPTRAAPMTSAAAPPPTLREVQRVALTLRGAPVSVETGSATIHAGPPEPLRSAVAPGVDEQGTGDDLTRIRGIDRRLADALTARGIRSFAGIASFTAADVRTLTAALGLGRRISAENWIEQAAVIATRDAAAKARADAIAADIARRLVVNAAAPGLDLSSAAALTPTTAPVPPEGAAAAMPHASIALVEAAARAAEPTEKPSLAATNDLPSIIRAAAVRIAAPAAQASPEEGPEAAAAAGEPPPPADVPIETAVTRAAAAIAAAIAANAATESVATPVNLGPAAVVTSVEVPPLPEAGGASDVVETGREEAATATGDPTPGHAIQSAAGVPADSGHGGDLDIPTPHPASDHAPAPPELTAPLQDLPATEEPPPPSHGDDEPSAEGVSDEPTVTLAATIADVTAGSLVGSADNDAVLHDLSSDASGTRQATNASRQGLSLAETADAATDPAPALAIVPAEAAAPVTATEAEQSQPHAASAEPDDLLAIRGLDVRTAEALASLGIRRYAEIAAWSASDIARVSAALDGAPGPYREGWIEQAAVLATGRLTAHATQRLTTGTILLAPRPDRDPERDPAFAIWLARHTSELPILRGEPAPAAPAAVAIPVPAATGIETTGGVGEATALQLQDLPARATGPDQPAAASAGGGASAVAGTGHVPTLPPPLPASAVADATARIATVTRPPVFENSIHIAPQAAPAAGAASPLQAISERLQALERDLATLDIVPLAPPQPRRSHLAGPSNGSAEADLAARSTEATLQAPASTPEPPAGPDIAPMTDDEAVLFDEAAVTIVRRAAQEIGLDPLPASAGNARGNEPAAAVPDDYAAYRGRVEEAAVEIVRPGAAARPVQDAAASAGPPSGEDGDGNTPVRRFLKALTGA